MEALVGKLIQHYETFNDDDMNGYGLYNGKTGLSVLYHTLHRVTGKDLFREKAHRLLDELGGNISAISTSHFTNGLAGVGWAIEWLSQNKYIEVNSDEILEDLDDRIYREVMYEPNASVGLKDGTLGASLYFLSRFRSRNYLTPRLRTIAHHECLVILTDELESKLADIKERVDATAITDLSQILVYAGKIWQYNINVEAIERIIYWAGSMAEHLLQLYMPGHVDLSLPLLHLAYARYYTGRAFKFSFWMEEAREYITATWHYVRDNPEILPLASTLYREHLISPEDYELLLRTDKNVLNSPILCCSVVLSLLDKDNGNIQNWEEYYLMG